MSRRKSRLKLMSSDRWPLRGNMKCNNSSSQPKLNRCSKDYQMMRCQRPLNSLRKGNHLRFQEQLMNQLNNHQLQDQKEKNHQLREKSHQQRKQKKKIQWKQKVPQKSSRMTLNQLSKMTFLPRKMTLCENCSWSYKNFLKELQFSI